jgi:hypothetical protein
MGFATHYRGILLMSRPFTNSKYVEKAVAANAYKNDGATVVYGGAVVSGDRVVTSTPGMTTVGYHSARHGSKVPSAHTSTEIGNGTYRRGTFKALAAGNYATLTEGRFIIRRYTQYLANVATNVLTFGSHLVARKSIHKLVRLRTTFVSARTWTAPSGDNASGDPKSTTTYTYTESDQNNLLFSPNTGGYDGADDAATPTRAVPGELVYIQGNAQSPYMDDYDAKTG